MTTFLTHTLPTDWTNVHDKGKASGSEISNKEGFVLQLAPRPKWQLGSKVSQITSKMLESQRYEVIHHPEITFWQTASIPRQISNHPSALFLSTR